MGKGPTKLTWLRFSLQIASRMPYNPFPECGAQQVKNQALPQLTSLEEEPRCEPLPQHCKQKQARLHNAKTLHLFSEEAHL